MDVDRAAKCSGKYPPLATDTEVNSCFSKNLNSEIIMHKKMTLIRLYLQRFRCLCMQIVYICNDFDVFVCKSSASCAALNKGNSEFE